MRKDPAHLEEALLKLDEARNIWKSPHALEEKQDLQYRILVSRDRIGVADFEVVGDVGIPRAGTLIADQIQPAFKGRFDLLDRAELNQAIERLNLPRALRTSDWRLREIGQFVRTRYLVVGSISAIAGLTVHAQLVDTKCGMITHAARLNVQNIDELARQCLNYQASYCQMIGNAGRSTH